MNKQIKVLSMGWGVQTVAMAAMCAHGDLEMPDLAVFADPMNESSETYDYIKEMGPWFKKKGLEVVTASAGDLRQDYLDGHGQSMPFFTLSPEGKKGQLRRQCTTNYKVYPVQRAIKKRFGIDTRRKVIPPVELWLGISTDEILRMKESMRKWIINKWPLIDKGISRQGCLDYIEKKGLPRPPKSACYFCPYHNDRMWRDMKNNSPNEFDKAIAFDRAIRYNPKLKYPAFLHASRQPLEDVDFTDNQIDFFNNECEGHCGI